MLQKIFNISHSDLCGMLDILLERERQTEDPNDSCVVTLTYVLMLTVENTFLNPQYPLSLFSG